jgi:hypothetical protein
MAPLYATQADFEAYVEGWVTDDAVALARYLERAERDVDSLFPLRPIIRAGTYTGRRFDVTLLANFEADALARAVCAQAEYLIDTGPDVAAGAAPASVKGPDFEVTHPTGPDGARRRYSAKLPNELLPLEPYRRRRARLRGR